ncbi:ferritin-like domain-containing protein [Massilia horti]|uniref:Ferritin-like domain-containing protein n=1 Tax=Massilia horti TaxID=2562153 RepID=A0A4Y9T0A6_9BURK|nr:ferritin-like domain-containing protein [Massilia horti]TFW32161.1 ferritin-like domain-containing protein [Massilia horti]
MSFLMQASDLRAGRRLFMSRSGLLLSASAVALLAGRDALAASAADSPASDAGILNSALGAEQEAIAAYQFGADSGLLKPDVKQIALTFQGHHKAHADLLAATVTKFGGKPVQPKAHYTFPEAKLKSQTDVLRFAADLEHGAVKAYLGAIPKFSDRQLSGSAGSILADEAMHWAVLRHALGEPPVPGPFVG